MCMTMTVTTSLVILAGLAAMCAGVKYNGFKVTFGKQPGQSYFDMPWTVAEARRNKQWEKIGEDKKLNVDVFSQHEDPSLMLLFDKKGNIAGLRMAFFKDEVAKRANQNGVPFEFDYDNNPIYEKGKYFGKELWYTSALFVSPAVLASGGRKIPLNKATDSVALGVYFRGDGKWNELSEDQCKQSHDFTEANCLPGMGKHYFYKTNITNCKHRQVFWSLYNEGRLTGFGLAGFGSFDKKPHTQNYFEDFPSAAVRSIIPKGPKCMESYISKYGLTGMHVYLTKDAAKITCPAQGQRAHCH